MPALNISLTADQLQKRLQDRLRGLNSNLPNTVLWQQHGDSVLLFIDSLHARLIPGWLLCGLDMQSDQTGRQNVQFVFYLGKTSSGDSLHAAATINAATPQASQLAEVWGKTVQNVLWEAVLDALEAFVGQASAKYPGQTIAIHGFQANSGNFSAIIMAGDY